MQMSLLLRIRFAFQKLLQTCQTSRNYQKRFLAMINHCLGNSQINSIPAWSKEFSYITFLYRTLAKIYTLAQADIIHSHVRPWKLTLSITRSIKVHRRALIPYSLPSLWKIHKRILQFSIFDPATWQHPREKPWHMIYDVRMAQFVLKIEKLSHIMGPRGSRNLRSPSPIMAPGGKHDQHRNILTPTSSKTQNIQVKCIKMILRNMATDSVVVAFVRWIAICDTNAVIVTTP